MDGTRLATVEVLREAPMTEPMRAVGLKSLDKLRTSAKNPLRSPVYRAPLTPLPNWVYLMYDPRALVQRVHDQISSLRLYGQTRVTVPRDPVELSFWVGINLPLDDEHRIKILELNNAVQRLRFELSLLDKCQIICCKSCNRRIGRQEDIFSMSQEGPQNAYVNPGGYVHQTLTLYKTQNLKLVGASSAEYSWFPGYSWTIAQCRYCNSHMGWKFTATDDKKLVPKKFWGISGRSIRPLMDVEPAERAEEIAQMEQDEQHGGVLAIL